MRLAAFLAALLLAVPAAADPWPSGGTSLGGGHEFANGAGGKSRVYKFGFHTDIDDDEESVWEGATVPALDGGPDRCPQDTSAFTLNISSDAAGDTEDIVVEGLDANWDAVSETVTLAGLTYTQVGTASNWMRVNRAYNVGTADLVGVVYLHDDAVDVAVADGIPDIPATQTKAVINAAENQTLQSCYTVPDGWTANVTAISLAALVGGAGNAVDFRLRLTKPTGVGRVQLLSSLGNSDSYVETFNPPLPYVARDMLELTAITAAANSNANVSGTFNLALFPTE